jgi:hypothetical protein
LTSINAQYNAALAADMGAPLAKEDRMAARVDEIMSVVIGNGSDRGAWFQATDSDARASLTPDVDFLYNIHIYRIYTSMGITYFLCSDHSYGSSELHLDHR